MLPDQVSERAVRTSVLRASFENKGYGTVLTDKYHTAPIKIAKSFPLEQQLGIIIMDVSPGLLEGDRYELDWSAGEDAHAYITNQSYTKVHPCSEEGGSSMSQTFTLHPGSIIEHMPEPVMLYKEASFHNETLVYLKAGAIWMQADVVCPGRTLRNEIFQYRGFRNSLSVYYEDELVFTQRQRVEPDIQQLNAPGSWEEMTHSGAFYVFSDKLTSAHLDAVIEKLNQLPETFGHHTVVAGASKTHKFGIAVLAASTAAWPLQQALRLIWEAVRQALLGKQALSFLKM